MLYVMVLQQIWTPRGNGPHASKIKLSEFIQEEENLNR